MAFTPQINQLRSLDYRANLLMGQGRYKEADKVLDDLLPLFDSLTQSGNDMKRVIGNDRKHYEILKFQCGEKGKQAEAGAQDWIKEVDTHLMAARALLGTDLRSSVNTLFRVQDMIRSKEAPPDIKKDLMAKVEALGNDVKQKATAIGEEARNTLFSDGPGACTKYEIAIDIMKRFGMNVQAKQLEEELGTAVYVSQTGSKLQDVQDRLKRADKAEDVERLQVEMEKMRTDIQNQSGSSGQGGQMQAYLAKILSEVEATKKAASEQKQIIVAQNVRIGDEINIKDSVVQRSQIGGGGAGGPVIAGEARSGSTMNVDNSVVMHSDLGATQQVQTDASLRNTSVEGTAKKTFAACPYCGEKLNLPKTPKFCPYCSEQLVR
jgi:hypothetical protein